MRNILAKLGGERIKGCPHTWWFRRSRVLVVVYADDILFIEAGGDSTHLIEKMRNEIDMDLAPPAEQVRFSG